LIYNVNTLEVVARPFAKFFNYGEEETHFALTEPVIVTDKMDGSLGIFYDDGDGGAIATRGSFTSEQAQHATEVWKARYAGKTPHPNSEWTKLFEIVYPENRIVCNYGDMDDIILLGSVNIRTGELSRTRFTMWPGPVVSWFAEHATLADALASPPRAGMEGLVVDFVLTGDRVKIKQEDYVILHRILTGVTARTLWEFVAVNACLGFVERGKKELNSVAFLTRKLQLSPQRINEILSLGPNWMATYLTNVPDEFYAWVRTRVNELTTAAASIRNRIQSEYDELVALNFTNRGDFVRAAWARTNDWQLIMSLLDGKQIETWVWMQVYPAPEKPFRGGSEDTA
jgi:RNA ligase